MTAEDPISRMLAIGLGVSVLGWQLVNLGVGRFLHEYLIADLVGSVVLLVAAGRSSSVGMFAGFAAFSGIFLAATTGKWIEGDPHPGTVAAGLGLIASIAGAARLGRRLAGRP